MGQATTDSMRQQLHDDLEQKRNFTSMYAWYSII